MAGRSLHSLPNEVLYEVCRELCLHCQASPDVFCDGPFDGTPRNCARSRLPAAVLVRLCACCPPKLPQSTVQKYERVRLHTAALSRLCRTSRRLNAIATPFLYHAFCLMTHRRRYFNFMRTLIQRPSLSTSVTQAAFNIYLRLGKDNIAFLDELVDHLGVRFPEDWDGSIDVLTGFLVDSFLTSAVNLRQLSLRASDTTEYGKSMPPSSTLQSLKSLRLVYWSIFGGFRLDAVARLLEKAPNLEHLEAYMCYSSPPGLNLPNLKVLILSMSTLRLGMLRNLASSCKQLKAFTFQYFQRPGMDTFLRDDMRVLTPKQISEELEPCSQTLEYLEIRVPDEELSTQLEREDMISSLAKFTALKTLDIDQSCFCRGKWVERTGCNSFHNLLPASIAKVTLRRVDMHHLSWDLAELAKKTKNGLFPNLKRLDIYFETYWLQHMAVALDKAFWDAGIVLETRVSRNQGRMEVEKIEY